MPDSAYTPEARRCVYAVLQDRAKAILSASHSVIVDAVYAEASDRDQIEAMADAVGVAFTGFWLEANPERLFVRVAARHNDASDATPRVVEAQIGARTRPLSRRWRSLNADGSAQQTFDLVGSAIGLRLPPKGAT